MQNKPWICTDKYQIPIKYKNNIIVIYLSQFDSSKKVIQCLLFQCEFTLTIIITAANTNKKCEYWASSYCKVHSSFHFYI